MNVKPEATKDRAIGALLGLAVGDAVAALRIGRFSANGTFLCATLLNNGSWFFVVHVAPAVAKV